MDARALWKSFAQSDEGRELAAQLEAAESDQLHKQADLDKKINDALRSLAKRMDDKPLVAERKCEAETFYRARYFHDHVELTLKLPVEMVVQLLEMWTHYQDHNCGEAAVALDEWTGALLMMMGDAVPSEKLVEFLGPDEEEEDEQGQ